MPTGNNNNLIPASERSKSEASENGRKGGKASGESRRRKKTDRIRLQQLAELVIDKNVLPSNFNEIVGRADYKTIIDLKLLDMAQKGNIRAMEMFNRIYGDDPFVTIRMKELEIRIKELELKNSMNINLSANISFEGEDDLIE